MKNEYLNNLIKTLKERSNTVQEAGTMEPPVGVSDLDFDKAYNTWKVLPAEEMLQYGRELYVFETPFRDLMNNDVEAKKKLANHRNMTIKGLND